MYNSQQCLPWCALHGSKTLLVSTPFVNFAFQGKADAKKAKIYGRIGKKIIQL